MAGVFTNIGKYAAALAVVGAAYVCEQHSGHRRIDDKLSQQISRLEQRTYEDIQSLQTAADQRLTSCSRLLAELDQRITSMSPAASKPDRTTAPDLGTGPLDLHALSAVDPHQDVAQSGKEYVSASAQPLNPAGVCVQLDQAIASRRQVMQWPSTASYAERKEAASRDKRINELLAQLTPDQRVDYFLARREYELARKVQGATNMDERIAAEKHAANAAASLQEGNQYKAKRDIVEALKCQPMNQVYATLAKECGMTVKYCAHSVPTVLLASGEGQETLAVNESKSLGEQIELYYHETVNQTPDSPLANLQNIFLDLGPGADQKVLNQDGAVMQGAVKSHGRTGLLEGVGNATVGTLCELFTFGNYNPFNDDDEGTGVPIAGAVYTAAVGATQVVGGANHVVQDALNVPLCLVPPAKFAANMVLNNAPGGDGAMRVLGSMDGVPIVSNFTRGGMQATQYNPAKLVHDNDRYARAVDDNATNTPFRQGLETVLTITEHAIVIHYASEAFDDGGEQGSDDFGGGVIDGGGAGNGDPGGAGGGVGGGGGAGN